MALPTLTETLDNFYTTTWQNMKGQVADQIFDATPFWFWMRSNNRITSQAGGRFITEPLSYAKNDSVKWFGRGGQVSLNDFEFMTVGTWDWRYLVGNVTRFGQDDQQNRGRHQIVNLATQKFQNLQSSLIDELETALFSSGGTPAGSDKPQIDGLELQVKEDPTTTALGGIDPATYTWWRNQTHNMTGVSFATDGLSEMRIMLNECSNNMGQDMPDIIVSGQTPYEYYEDIVVGYFETSNLKMADAGFTNQAFKGIPMVWSPACNDESMFFLNTRFLSFYYDPIMFFDMTEWKPIPDQVNDRAAQVILACALTQKRRRCHGVIHTIDTA